MLFPHATIAILREARWSPDAARTLEVMSGGFMWSDERLDDVACICTQVDSWAFREVIAYRASLIRGVPRTELREPWDQLHRECPSWPGFRLERCDPSLKETLDAENEEVMRQLDHMSEVCERARRINAIREKRKGK
jgi:hypothetical protein